MATTPAVLVASVLYGACGTVDEILVGTFEMLTTMKVNYANASNVAILVSFGPVVTTFMAKAFCRRAQPTFRKVWVGRGVNSCDSQ